MNKPHFILFFLAAACLLGPCLLEPCLAAAAEPSPVPGRIVAVVVHPSRPDPKQIELLKTYAAGEPADIKEFKTLPYTTVVVEPNQLQEIKDKLNLRVFELGPQVLGQMPPSLKALYGIDEALNRHADFLRLGLGPEKNYKYSEGAPVNVTTRTAEREGLNIVVPDSNPWSSAPWVIAVKDEAAPEVTCILASALKLFRNVAAEMKKQGCKLPKISPDMLRRTMTRMSKFNYVDEKISREYLHQLKGWEFFELFADFRGDKKCAQNALDAARKLDPSFGPKIRGVYLDAKKVNDDEIHCQIE